MNRLVIEIPDENVELLLALLPKLNGRLISRISSAFDQSQVDTKDIIETLVEYDGQYFYDTFDLTESRYEELKAKYPNSVNKNNRDVG